MIKNERQYKMTKAQADRFESALGAMSSAPSSAHPLLIKAQEDAMRSQLVDLRSEIEEYDALRTGRKKVLQIVSFADLPKALVQGRIAANLSQKELAERMGIKEQQVQQYESTEYASASFSRLQEVIDALGLVVRKEIFLPSAEVSGKKVIQRGDEIGVDRALLLDRIVPRQLAARLRQGPDEANAALETASILERVFGTSPIDVFGDAPLRLDSSSLSGVRFKVPANANSKKVTAYAVYAHYLALLALEATSHLKIEPIPAPLEAHRQVVERYGAMTFENGLRYIWDLGIPVVPLSDPGTFHGACWRAKGRNVIVLKQKVKSPARWLFDGGHELGHAAQDPELSDFAAIDLVDPLLERENSEDEEDATYFGEEWVFGRNPDDIAHEVARLSRGRVQVMSSVVPSVARKFGVPADSLANHIAHMMSVEGQEWWGAATNLQRKDIDPVAYARNLFLERAMLSNLGEFDRGMLLRALSDEED